MATASILQLLTMSCRINSMFQILGEVGYVGKVTI